jgi:cytochrome c oxidase cbb3-type subunit 3
MKLRDTQNFVGIAAALLLFSALGSCSRSQRGGAVQAPIAGVPSQSWVGSVPLGQIAGSPTLSAAALSTANPYESNPQAIEAGKQLYLKMNCAGCHAYNGKGNMGPDLTDRYWRYGGLPIQIYQSILEGRPEGMPSWGAALPPEEIWRIVAYIQSWGGAFSVADYEHARQGDEPGEQVAPEAQAEAALAPPAPTTATPAAPEMGKSASPAAPLKTGEARP